MHVRCLLGHLSNQARLPSPCSARRRLGGSVTGAEVCHRCLEAL